jgi:hypothetical protein
MDSEGWIAISLLANFNRVRTLSPDPALVHEVLMLSHHLEVHNGRVRMRDEQWKQFVLPSAQNAGASILEEGRVEEQRLDSGGEVVVSPDAGTSWTPTKAQ